MKSIARKFGYIPDCGDHRDIPFSAAGPTVLPLMVDLLQLFPPVYDQGHTGSCVAQSTAAAHWFCHKKQGALPVDPSRLFIYYEARRMRGWQKMDSGCMIRDAIKILVKEGVCPEADWPFVQAKVTTKPPHDCYLAAGSEQVIAYYRMGNSLDGMRGCLAAGFPFVCGITLYDGFMSAEVARSGVVLMPGHRERAVGGHAVVVLGYNDEIRRFICRNSWSPKWGKKGYFTIPYDYLGDGNLCTDIWTLRGVE